MFSTRTAAEQLYDRAFADGVRTACETILMYLNKPGHRAITLEQYVTAMRNAAAAWEEP